MHKNGVRLISSRHLFTDYSEGYLFLPSICTEFVSYFDRLFMESERHINAGVRTRVVVGVPVAVDIARIRRVAGVRDRKPPVDATRYTTNNLFC